MREKVPQTDATVNTTPQDGLPVPHRYWAAGTVMIGMSLAVLDTTIANVGLPTIAIHLNALPAQAVWIANAYNLAVVMTLLPLSALAERIGFRRMFTSGLILFTLASLACALSGSLLQLTLARVFQGLGAAALMCLFGGLVRSIYPIKLLGRGISINATLVAVMSVLGPTIGSAILSVASWPWIFAVNLPICALAMLGLRHLPEPRPSKPVAFDAISALLSMAMMGIFISGVDMMGINLLSGIGLVAIAILLALVLIYRAKGKPAPLVPVDLLRIRPLAFAVGASVCTFAAQMAAYVSLPFYFQHILGRPYLEVGMLMGAWPIGTALIAALAGRLSDRYSAATLSGIGAGVMVLGMCWLTFLPFLSLQASNLPILIGMFVAGIGFGFFQTPNNRAMLSAAPPARSGAVGGLQATTRVFGQSFGTALVAIAFSLSTAYGPVLALVLGTLCAGLAVIVNTVRFKSIG